MIVADNTLMSLIINPSGNVPGKVPVSKLAERIDYLIQRIENSGQKILIPTPVLSELLIGARNLSVDVTQKLSRYACFEICPFDHLASVELAEITKQEIGSKRLSREATYAKLRFDRQIVSIAKVRKAKAIFSDDDGVENCAKMVGIQIIKIADLPLPPDKAEAKQKSKSSTDQESDQHVFDFLNPPEPHEEVEGVGGDAA